MVSLIVQLWQSYMFKFILSDSIQTRENRAQTMDETLSTEQI